MQDRIDALAHELRKGHNLKAIDREIKKFLVDRQIISRASHALSTVLHRNTDNCTYLCKLEHDKDIFHKEVTIMIKPDHSEHRALRVVIQFDNQVFQDVEDKDKTRWSDKKVFRKELKDAEHYIEEFLANQLKNSFN